MQDINLIISLQPVNIIIGFVVYILSMTTVRYAFRLSSTTDLMYSFILQANDDLDKRHWVQCIGDALAQLPRPTDSAESTQPDTEDNGEKSPTMKSPARVSHRRHKTDRDLPSPTLSLTSLASTATTEHQPSSTTTLGGYDVYSLACQDSLLGVDNDLLNVSGTDLHEEDHFWVISLSFWTICMSCILSVESLLKPESIYNLSKEINHRLIFIHNFT